MAENTLKPCPFCGGRLKVSDDGSEYLHPINDCILAEADSEYGPLWIRTNSQKHIDAWNRRACDEEENRAAD